MVYTWHKIVIGYRDSHTATDDMTATRALLDIWLAELKA